MPVVEALIQVPAGALVMLAGAAGAGKSTFARRHFRPTEIVSSDECRALVADDSGDQSATPAAFRILHRIVAERLRAHRLAVVDATNAGPRSRRPLLKLAARYGRPAVAIVLDLHLDICLERNRGRTGRAVPDLAVRRQHALLAASLAGLAEEGFARIYVLGSPAAVEAVAVRATRGSAPPAGAADLAGNDPAGGRRFLPGLD